MRVMVDSNIIISAGLFPESIVGKALHHIVINESLVLCKYTLEELSKVFINKFPDRITYFHKFIDELKYELVEIEINYNHKYPNIRDIYDLPLLASAIEAKIDILVTGDKDFEEINLKNIKIMKPREYTEKFIKQ